MLNHLKHIVLIAFAMNVLLLSCDNDNEDLNFKEILDGQTFTFISTCEDENRCGFQQSGGVGGMYDPYDYTFRNYYIICDSMVVFLRCIINDTVTVSSYEFFDRVFNSFDYINTERCTLIVDFLFLNQDEFLTNAFGWDPENFSFDEYLPPTVINSRVSREIGLPSCEEDPNRAKLELTLDVSLLSEKWHEVSLSNITLVTDVFYSN